MDIGRKEAQQAAPVSLEAGLAHVIVVAAADNGWRSLALNWALSLERVGLRNYILFAADSKVGETGYKI